MRSLVGVPREAGRTVEETKVEIVTQIRPAGEPVVADQSDPTAEAMPTVFLHVGTMKSGTTFIQRRLQANSDEFHSQGVLVPSSRGASILAAARDVLGLKAP